MLIVPKQHGCNIHVNRIIHSLDTDCIFNWHTLPAYTSSEKSHLFLFIKK